MFRFTWYMLATPFNAERFVSHSILNKKFSLMILKIKQN